jgi:hypothetical protein
MHSLGIFVLSIAQRVMNITRNQVKWINLVAGALTIACSIDRGSLLLYMVGCANLLVFMYLQLHLDD